MAGIGIFVCDCDGQISERIDLATLGNKLQEHPDVVEVISHTHLCSEAGLDLIEEALAGKGLGAVLVAACAQDLYEVTFRPVLARADLGPGQTVNLDLRVSSSRDEDVNARTTHSVDHALALLGRLEIPTDEFGLELEAADNGIVRRALVIGGGIGGIQAALDIANSGHEVVLVERQPSIGGHMIQLSETFPSLDCSQCILTPKMAEVGRHPKIRLLTTSEVRGLAGRLGHFTATIERKPRYVLDNCTACGDCVEACPVPVCDQFNTGLRWRKAIYQPFPQAVPSIFALDAEHCLGLFPLACGKCEQVCEPCSIDYDMQPTFEQIDVGAVVVATGYEMYGYGDISEYGYGKYDDVINGLQFERLLSASGPTMGKVVRPSDGTEPKEVVFIQCVRSRDPERGMPYCSGICCMYTAKHAMLFKHRVPDGQAFVFYMDIRAGGKGYEEFVQRAMENEGVMYLRGRVSKVFEENGRIVVWGVDTLVGKRIEIAADLVVLATAIVPNDGHERLAEVTHLDVDEHGFFTAAHAKVDPVGSSVPGIYLVGCCLGPTDIPETVAQASGAAAKVSALFAQGPKMAVAEPAAMEA
jgi:heterodisulfide reductase subunit A